MSFICSTIEQIDWKRFINGVFGGTIYRWMPDREYQPWSFYTSTTIRGHFRIEILCDNDGEENSTNEKLINWTVPNDRVRKLGDDFVCSYLIKNARKMPWNFFISRYRLWIPNKCPIRSGAIVFGCFFHRFGNSRLYDRLSILHLFGRKWLWKLEFEQKWTADECVRTT